MNPNNPGDGNVTLQERLRTTVADYEGRVPDIQIEAADTLDAREAEIGNLKVALESIQIENRARQLGNDSQRAEIARLTKYSDELFQSLIGAHGDNQAQEQRIKELEAVLEGFRNIAFAPCKDERCYRPTLTMMQKANTALSPQEDR